MPLLNLDSKRSFNTTISLQFILLTNWQFPPYHHTHIQIYIQFDAYEGCRTQLKNILYHGLKLYFLTLILGSAKWYYSLKVGEWHWHPYGPNGETEDLISLDLHVTKVFHILVISYRLTKKKKKLTTVKSKNLVLLNI